MKTFESPITQIVSEIRNISEQISLLLKSADNFFEKNNFRSINGGSVTGENSTSIDKPKYWFPEFFCRFYNSQDYPNVQMFFSVILDNRGDNQSYDFNRPIVTAGYFLEHTEPTKTNWWLCRWHVYTENKNYDGKICVLRSENKTTWKEKETKFFKIMKSIAIYLEDTTSSEILNTKLLEPLFREFQNEKKDRIENSYQ